MEYVYQYIGGIDWVGQWVEDVEDGVYVYFVVYWCDYFYGWVVYWCEYEVDVGIVDCMGYFFWVQFDDCVQCFDCVCVVGFG